MAPGPSFLAGVRNSRKSPEAPYEPPDALELLDLGLAGCSCHGLRRLELLGSLLADEQQDPALRAMVTFPLAAVEGPRALESLTAAASDRHLLIRMAARLALRLVRRHPF
ncbi:MAG: hypothetical protein M3198_07065 [Actinomycetota bacterium]|nr:hypothetical protein [Actinomycetota bacterium]